MEFIGSSVHVFSHDSFTFENDLLPQETGTRIAAGRCLEGVRHTFSTFFASWNLSGRVSHLGRTTAAPFIALAYRCRHPFARRHLFFIAAEREDVISLKALYTLGFRSEVLHYAVEENKSRTVTALAELGVELSTFDAAGYTPLHIAVRNRNVEMISLLVRLGMPIDTPDTQGRSAEQVLSDEWGKEDFTDRDERGRTLVHLLAESGVVDDLKVVSVLGGDFTVQEQTGRTPLHVAAQLESVECAKFLIEQGVEINVQDLQGKTPLHIAIERNNNDLVRLLIENGANAETQDRSGNAPIHIATVQENYEAVSMLVELGASVNALNSLGKAPLYLAAERGDSAMIQLLIGCGANKDIQDDPQGNTPLHIATMLGQEGAVVTLLELGVNKDATNQQGRTSLHLASMRGDSQMIFQLLEFGCDRSLLDNKQKRAGQLFGANLRLTNYIARDSLKRSLFHLFALNNHVDYIRALAFLGEDVNTTDKAGATALHIAARAGRKEAVQELLQQGINVNKKDHEGKTALHFAASQENHDVIQMLIESGADVKVRDNKGREAIHIAAATEGRESVVELLVKTFSANIDAVDKYKKTPLHYAIELRNKGLFWLLVNLGASLTACDYKKRNALHLALLYEFSSFFNYLAESGVDVNAQDVEGSAVLHYAVSFSYPDAVSLFIDHGASVHISDQSGNTPLHLAAQAGSMGMTQILLERGANVCRENHQGKTPLHLAVESGHYKVVQLLLASSTEDVKEAVKQLFASINRRPSFDVQDKEGETLLYELIRKSKYGSVEIYLALGGKANIQNNRGQSPLHAAVSLASNPPLMYSVVEALRRFGANPDVKDNEEKTPADLFAAFFGRESFYEQSESRSGGTLLHSFVCSNQYQEIKNALALGVDPNVLDRKGRSPLHWAIEAISSSRMDNIVELLVQAGANPHLRDLKGKTPAEKFARRFGLEDLNQPDRHQRTLLYRLVREKQIGNIKMFIALGGDVNAQDYKGRSPLHIAVMLPKADSVVRLLLEKGANPFLQDREGNTPLHLIPWERARVFFNQLEKQRFLIRNREGLTPLDIWQNVLSEAWAKKPKGEQQEICLTEEEYNTRAETLSDTVLRLWCELPFEEEKMQHWLSCVVAPLTPEEIEGILRKMLEYIREKTPWIGTPPEEEKMELDLFYSYMLCNFEKIAQAAQEAVEMVDRAEILFQATKAAREGRCASAYQAELEQTAKIGGKEQIEGVEKALEQKAIRAFQTLVEACCEKLGGSNSHVVLQIKYLFGFSPISDHLAEDYPELIEQTFAAIFSGWSVPSLLKPLKETLNTLPYELKEEFFDWIKEKTEEVFGDKYLQIKEEAKLEEGRVQEEMRLKLSALDLGEKVERLIFSFFTSVRGINLTLHSKLIAEQTPELLAEVFCEEIKERFTYFSPILEQEIRTAFTEVTLDGEEGWQQVLRQIKLRAQLTNLQYMSFVQATARFKKDVFSQKKVEEELLYIGVQQEKISELLLIKHSYDEQMRALCGTLMSEARESGIEISIALQEYGLPSLAIEKERKLAFVKQHYEDETCTLNQKGALLVAKHLGIVEARSE